MIRDWKSVDRIFNDIAETRHFQVGIDLSKLDCIPSAGLSIRLSLREGSTERGKHIAIVGAVD